MSPSDTVDEDIGGNAIGRFGFACIRVLAKVRMKRPGANGPLAPKPNA